MPLLKKLKTLLQSNIFYVVFTLICTFYVLTFTKIVKYDSIYNDGDISLTAKIINYSIDEKKVSFALDAGELVFGTFYYDNPLQIAALGFDKTLKISGQIKTPKSNTIPNTFNYQKYLYNSRIYKTMTIKKMEIKNNSSFWAKIKTKVYNRVKDNAYLKLFIVADKKMLDSEVYAAYQNCGAAHLLAVSGMHVSFLIIILKKLLFFLNSKKQGVLISLFLLFYSYIVGFTASVMRVTLCYILSLILKK